MYDKGIQLLLVEDNEGETSQTLKALRTVSAGKLEITCLPSLSAALACLRKTTVDVILLDLYLPDSRGVETFLRVREESPEIAVVVLLNDFDESLTSRLIQEGAQDVLLKRVVEGQDLLLRLYSALERQQVLANLKGYDRLKFELVSTASHELRTPLTIIREFVSLVHDGVAGAVTAEQLECLDSALRNCDRLSALINDLLDLSRIESGNLKLKRRKTEVLPLLRECHNDFLLRCASANQHLILEIPEDLPAALCDRDKINQVIINLIGNAHKYTPEGGTIRIRGLLQPPFIRVEVQDNGIGINQRNQALIFEAFTQINRQAGPGPKGTGLGLAISKHIIQLHGGNISLKSALGEGSLFSFTLPFYTEGSEIPAFVEDRLRIAKSSGKELSLVCMRPKDGNGAPVASNSESTLAGLRKLQAMAEKTFRDYRDESLLVESQELLFFLLESNETGSEIVLQRLEQVLVHEQEMLPSFEFAMAEITSTLIPEVLSKLRQARFEPLQVGQESRPRVLIIDDDELMLLMMVRALESSKRPFEIQSTTSGYQGCIWFGEFEPDLVILDVQMPEIDGREVLKSMKGSGHRKSAKFLAVSGYQDRGQEMLDLGCDCFLAKPFSVSGLIEKAVELTASAWRKN